MSDNTIFLWEGTARVDHSNHPEQESTHNNDNDLRQHSFLTALHEHLAAQINLLLNDGTHKKLCIPGKQSDHEAPSKKRAMVSN